ncbi:MAG: metal-dependent hydrolase, partial [Candidatus Limnocylindria bacterium]
IGQEAMHGREHRAFNERLAALGYPPDRAAAYVCVGTACSAPLAAPEELLAELERARARLERTE